MTDSLPRNRPPGTSPSSAAHPAPPHRRSFLAWATHGLGVLFAAVIGFPAVAYLIDARKRPARKAGFKTVARLSDLHVDVPRQFVITDLRRDAWTLHPNDVVGRVWIIRRHDQGDPQDQVDVYTTICPHLGCSVNYQEGQTLFICPCHGGTFDLETCARVELPGQNNPAPRGMDKLEHNLVRDPASPADKPDYFIQVKYQNFIQGDHEKVAKT